MSGEINKLFKKKYLLILIALLLSVEFIRAQSNDSISHDTLVVYKKIKKAAYKHKATRFLYHTIFVDPVSVRYQEKPLSDEQKKEDPYLKYECKIIRNIYIEVLDPFGYSVNDTSKKEINLLQIAGNKYHVTTRHRIIRNLLLFKQNDELELIRLNESERLIREARYVNDARIYIESDNSDSVDVKVIVQDNWALDAPGTFSRTGGHITLRDRNILGSGQEFGQYFSYNTNGNYELRGRHIIPNISNSFVSSNIFYSTTQDMTQVGASFEKPFYSALAKWAGGVSGDQKWGIYKYSDTLEIQGGESALNYYHTDVWIARNINTGTGKRINRKFNNIALALRYAQTHYQERPSFLIDTNKLNLNTDLYLGSVGFSLSKYYKDQYIFRFGANEDIPEGIIIQALYGAQYKELSKIRYYAGFNISRGKHFYKIGYFSVYAIYGSFFNDTQAGNATLNLGFLYFTDLLRSKKWYYRQFIYFKYINGISKPVNEKITLRPDELYGFNSGSLAGSSKMILNLEGVTYVPYNLIGFRFAPLILMGFGMLESDDVKLFAGHLYQSYAIGLLIRNESLLNSSFQITCGAYPYLPDGNNHYFKFNPVISFTVKFRSFTFSKPEVVSYN